MANVHAPHDDLKGTYLFDGCERCDDHSRKLYDLDPGTLAWLAEKAEELRVFNKELRMYNKASRSVDLSMNEHRAITHLRLYARLTFQSGITEEAAFG